MSISSPTAVKVTAKKAFSYVIPGSKKVTGKIGLEYLGQNKASYFACSGEYKEWNKDTCRWRGGGYGSVFGPADAPHIARALGVPADMVSDLLLAKQLDVWPSATSAESVPAANMAFRALSVFFHVDQFGDENDDYKKSISGDMSLYDTFAASRGVSSLSSLYAAGIAAAQPKLDAIRRASAAAMERLRADVAAKYAEASGAIAAGRSDASELLSEAAAMSRKMEQSGPSALAAEWRCVYKAVQDVIASSDLAAALHTFAHDVAARWV